MSFPSPEKIMKKKKKRNKYILLVLSYYCIKKEAFKITNMTSRTKNGVIIKVERGQEK